MWFKGCQFHRSVFMNKINSRIRFCLWNQFKEITKESPKGMNDLRKWANVLNMEFSNNENKKKKKRERNPHTCVVSSKHHFTLVRTFYRILSLIHALRNNFDCILTLSIRLICVFVYSVLPFSVFPFTYLERRCKNKEQKMCTDKS